VKRRPQIHLHLLGLARREFPRVHSSSVANWQTVHYSSVGRNDALLALVAHVVDPAIHWAGGHAVGWNGTVGEPDGRRDLRRRDRNGS
jgi:hypothetical protein